MEEPLYTTSLRFRTLFFYFYFFPIGALYVLQQSLPHTVPLKDLHVMEN